MKRKLRSIAKKVKWTCIYFFENLKDEYVVLRKKAWERKKFRDKRRVDIWSKIELTNEQQSAIDKLFKSSYGTKIPYIWHRHFTAYTGKFDVNYFPELLYIPEFERYMNQNEYYVDAINDKNLLSLLAKGAGVCMPRTIITVANGMYRDESNTLIHKEDALKILHNLGEAFIKPTVDSCSGVGCAVIDIRNGKDIISDRNIEEIIEEKGNNFVIQERLECHSSIKKIYEGSVNTFRIMTYRWNDEILHVPVILRIGKGGNYLDNAHAGGIFIAVDDDGTLHAEAYTEFLMRYREHPDTHLKFEGYKIELFPEVLKTAKRMHMNIPQLGVINWDFTINKEGKPILIEANARNGGIWLFEMAHGCGPFGDRTEEILSWMKKMRKLKKVGRQELVNAKYFNIVRSK